MAYQQQQWLEQQLQYTQAMEERDSDGEYQSAAEQDIAMQLFYGFEEYSLYGHARYAYSSKKSSVVLHTPYSLFDVYGKQAVRAELPRPLFPLRHAASGLREHSEKVNFSALR